jgi:molybdopterin-guanine dinucleotide biosynthesis protein A
VLAGGSSRRLGGTPKGLEPVDGIRIVDRVAAALRDVTVDLLLVANDADASRWLPGASLISDRHPGTGGLAGVEAALATGGCDALVVAWDMPFVTPAILRAILEAAAAHGADIVLPESDSPYGFEPFCAYYSARVLPSLSQFLERGGGAARDFIGRASRVHLLPAVDVASVGDPRRMFFSVNTPADLERARAMANATE